MTTKSPCRSTYRRIHNPSSYSTKTRRIWHNTNLNYYRPCNQNNILPIYPTVSMRNNYNQLHLLTTNRPKIPNCIFFRKSHSTSNCSHYNPNTIKLYRSYHTYNRPRTYLLPTILPSKHKLRTNPQPNHNYNPRATNNLPTDSNLMNSSQPSKPSFTPIN